jgi:hypothetical protein
MACLSAHKILIAAFALLAVPGNPGAERTATARKDAETRFSLVDWVEPPLGNLPPVAPEALSVQGGNEVLPTLSARRVSGERPIYPYPRGAGSPTISVAPPLPPSSNAPGIRRPDTFRRAKPRRVPFRDGGRGSRSQSLSMQLSRVGPVLGSRFGDPLSWSPLVAEGALSSRARPGGASSYVIPDKTGTPGASIKSPLIRRVMRTPLSRYLSVSSDHGDTSEGGTAFASSADGADQPGHLPSAFTRSGSARRPTCAGS